MLRTLSLSALLLVNVDSNFMCLDIGTDVWSLKVPELQVMSTYHSKRLLGLQMSTVLHRCCGRDLSSNTSC